MLLHITATLREFLVISGLGHVVYGLTLGAGVHLILGRQPAAGAQAPLDEAS